MRNTIIALLMAAALVSCDDQSYTPPPAAKAEDIVNFKDLSFACVSKDNLREEMGHAVGNENTLFSQMILDMRCFLIPTNQKFKVLAVDHEGWGKDLLLVTNSKNIDAEYAVWTYSDFLNKNFTNEEKSQ